MLFAPLFSLASAALAVASPIVVHPLQPRTGGPVIDKPAANAVIQPGETFDFLYYSMADYGRSAYNTSIWLFSSAPGDLQANTKTDTLTTGHFFGRFSTGNYPGNPYPNQPVPKQLTMPDFSVNQGGFGSGKTASDAPMYLAVFEEWADGSGTLGNKIAYVSTPIVYNGTKSE
ncbi:hypothetical protein EV715DRAFT_206321 [Schizophyllum commune]